MCRFDIPDVYGCEHTGDNCISEINLVESFKESYVDNNVTLNVEIP